MPFLLCYVFMFYSHLYFDCPIFLSPYSPADLLPLKAGEDCVLGLLPFFHVYGIVVVLLNTLRMGVKVVTLPQFEPKLFLDTMQNHKVSKIIVKHNFFFVYTCMYIKKAINKISGNTFFFTYRSIICRMQIF